MNEKSCVLKICYLKKKFIKFLRVNLFVFKIFVCYSIISCFILDRYCWVLLMEGVIWCVFYKIVVF